MLKDLSIQRTGEPEDLEARTSEPGDVPAFGSGRDHLPYALGALVTGAAVLAWRLAMSRSFFEDYGQTALGIVALVLLGAVLAFSVRKHLYGTRLGTLRPYYLVHLWMGGLCGPVAFLHADVHARGPFYITLAALTGLVWLGSFAGLALQGMLQGIQRRHGGEAILLEDLLGERERLGREIRELLEMRSEGFGLFVPKEVTQSFRGVKSLLQLVTDPQASARALEASLAKIESQSSTLSLEEISALRRIVEDEAALQAIQAQISLYRLRSGWLTFHVVGSVPAVVLILIHLAAVLRY